MYEARDLGGLGRAILEGDAAVRVVGLEYEGAARGLRRGRCRGVVVRLGVLTGLNRLRGVASRDLGLGKERVCSVLLS